MAGDSESVVKPAWGDKREWWWGTIKSIKKRREQIKKQNSRNTTFIHGTTVRQRVRLGGHLGHADFLIPGAEDGCVSE